jgi:hypothetical protein
LPRSREDGNVTEGHHSKKVYILTARHVIIPPSAESDKLHNYMQTRRQHCCEVILPGPKAFQTVLKSTMVKIGHDKMMVNHHNEQLDYLKTCGDINRVAQEQTAAERNLRAMEASIKAHNQFHDEATKYWSEESQRIIGHVAYSPPITIGTGTECYTEDWALIELDNNKIDWNNFEANVIDLGTF